MILFDKTFSTNDIENIYYSAPDGYEFDTITQLRRMADNRSYMFAVTGRCQKARAVIKVAVRRPRILLAGMYGNEELLLQPHGEIYSYDSSVTTDPAPANSTGEANAGSNNNILLRPGVVLDGVLLLGEDEFGFSPAPIAGYANQKVGRMDPDPLGADTGMLAEAFAYYSDPDHNDNATVGGTDDDGDDGPGGGPPGDGPPGKDKDKGGNGGGGAITENILNLGPNESIEIAGGHYYLERLYVGPNSTLNLTGNSSDPVVFFLTGEVDIKPNSEVVTASGKPTDFLLFSNSDDDIKLFPNGDFEGLIYAPYADINLQPNSAVRGLVFGNNLTLNPGSESFIDTCLLDVLTAPYVEVTQWRHVVN